MAVALCGKLGPHRIEFALVFGTPLFVVRCPLGRHSTLDFGVLHLGPLCPSLLKSGQLALLLAAQLLEIVESLLQALLHSLSFALGDPTLDLQLVHLLAAQLDELLLVFFEQGRQELVLFIEHALALLLSLCKGKLSLVTSRRKMIHGALELAPVCLVLDQQFSKPVELGDQALVDLKGIHQATGHLLNGPTKITEQRDRSRVRVAWATVVSLIFGQSVSEFRGGGQTTGTRGPLIRARPAGSPAGGTGGKSSCTLLPGGWFRSAHFGPTS